MNRFHTLKARLWAGTCFAVIAAAVYAFSSACVIGADSKSATTKQTAEKKTAVKKEKQPAKKLDGAALYATHCNRCHAERYATERTDAQWKTIMMHMQTRAQLPGKDAKAILKYLQENN